MNKMNKKQEEKIISVLRELGDALGVPELKGNTLKEMSDEAEKRMAEQSNNSVEETPEEMQHRLIMEEQTALYNKKHKDLMLSITSMFEQTGFSMVTGYFLLKQLTEIYEGCDKNLIEAYTEWKEIKSNNN